MSRFKILIADGMAADAVQALKANASFEVEFRKETSSAELLNLVPHFDALLVRSATQVTPEVLDRATRLKLVLRLGAGVDNIDVKYAKSKNIEVMNTASANAQSAAEHAIALMFALARHIPQAYASLKRGEWNRSQFVGFELTGKALAIIGFGQIGRIVAEKALGLGMRVMAYDPMVEEAPAHLRAVELVKDLKELVSRADLVTLHLPKIPATSNLLNGDLFSHFKKGSYLINAARGGIVDESALLEALDSGHLAAAAVDVFEKEPPVFPNRLVDHPKVLPVPHLGASTFEAQDRVGSVGVELLQKFFA